MITALKQNWNRLALVFLTLSIVQITLEYGKMFVYLKRRSSSSSRLVPLEIHSVDFFEQSKYICGLSE